MSLDDVAAEAYIMWSVDEAAAATLKCWSSMPYLPSICLRTRSVELVRSMVANCQGVTIH